MERLYEILEDCRPDIDFRGETALIDGGLLESLDIVMIVGEISEEFGVEITADDLTPENFNSAEAIYSLICALGGEE